MPLMAVNVRILHPDQGECDHTFNNNASAAHYITDHQLVPEERERRVFHTDPFQIGVTYEHTPLFEQEYVDTIICRTIGSLPQGITQHELDSRWRRFVAIDDMNPYSPEYPTYVGGMRGGASAPGIAAMGAECASPEDLRIWRANWHQETLNPNPCTTRTMPGVDIDRFEAECLNAYLGIGTYAEQENKRRQEYNEALKKAESLLNTCLTTAEAVEFSQLGTITIDTPLGLFRVSADGRGYSAPSFNVLHKGKAFCLVITQGGVAPEIPYFDHIAMQVLLIKNDPAKFLKEANKQGDGNDIRRAYYRQGYP